MLPFTLSPQLEKDTLFIHDLRLSSLRLMNDTRFPWFVLVPRRANLREWVDLLPGDQRTLMREINSVSRMMQKMFNPDKLNIAALGNMVPQLHIHIIARFTNDAAWPKPVWGVGDAVPYEQSHLDHITPKIISCFAKGG
jgi:diadenosine tetraphosphate (Ap4A) HIT family hydrolase